MALRSTLGYLIMPLWGERSGNGSVLVAHCRRSKLRWVIRDGVCPMVLCPNGAQGIAGSLNEARWSYAPTGRRNRWFIQRSSMVLCPNGAQGDSPGQSEAPPWDSVRTKQPKP
ncbi:MAG: hypothetical protein DWH99_15605 [Planctomycetota bacterium]|nr:MAG: hypothetical protein DWH99_15605 [Planctomycetota bacterium]